MKTFIKNANIYTGVSNGFNSGNLLIINGMINRIGDFDLNEKVDRVIDATGKIIIPGLINSHTHSYTGLLKGTVDNIPLDIYMLHAIAGGSLRSPEEIYISTIINILQMLKSGTTSVIDHFSERPKISKEGIDSIAKAYDDAGMRVTLAPMYADMSYFDTVPMEEGELPKELISKNNSTPQTPEEYIEICEWAINKYHNYKDRIRLMIGTDGVQRCSKKLLKLTGDIESKYKVGWHTHILEAKTQVVMGNKLYGRGLIEELDSFGLINERTGLVHYVWGSDIETQIIIDRKANMIHCPSSNIFLGNGIPPIIKFLKNNMHISIGSDGGNCGNLNMFEKMRLAALIHRVSDPDYENWITAKQILKIVLNGGSRAMLLQNEIGSLEVGKKADFLILDTNNTTWEPINNLIRQLVYYENGSSIESVFVEGVEVIHKGKSTLINEEEIIERAKLATKRIKQDNKEAFDLANKQEPYFRQMHLRVASEDIIR